MGRFNLKFKSLGSVALLIEWPNKIDDTILHDILSLQSRIEAGLTDVISETVSAYNSLTVIMRDGNISTSGLEEKIKALYNSSVDSATKPKRVWKVPVCYDKQFGIDIEEIALSKGIATKDVIDLHSEPEYVIYFIGFLPGFLYLGGLPTVLHTPRKSQPRLRIEKGAVAIGGQQTGVYPSESPGGWNIIGNSPISFFNSSQNPPCFAQPGDHLKFYSVTLKEHEKIMLEVLEGKYKPELHAPHE